MFADKDFKVIYLQIEILSVALAQKDFIVIFDHRDFITGVRS